MNIKYDNSMYCTTPNEPLVCIPVDPNEEMEWKIMQREDELKYDNSFEDIEAERNRELIKYGQNERI